MQITDRPVGRSVAETLRLVEALQFADKHGEGNVWDNGCRADEVLS